MKMKSSILAGLAGLCLLLPSLQDKTLKQVAKPYLGVYECTQATLGSKDLLKSFTEITLELTDEEHFVLFYKEKSGERKKVEGSYRYDEEKGTLTLTEQGSGIQKSFPLEKGKLTVSLPVGRKRLVLQFKQK